MVKYSFREALPVWEEGKENEMNYNLVFRAVINKAEKIKIAINKHNIDI